MTIERIHHVARDAVHLVHPDVPGNVAARLVQEVGDARAAIARAPHRLHLSLDIERSLSSPLEGRGVMARWDPSLPRARHPCPLRVRLHA